MKPVLDLIPVGARAEADGPGAIFMKVLAIARRDRKGVAAKRVAEARGVRGRIDNRDGTTGEFYCRVRGLARVRACLVLGPGAAGSRLPAARRASASAGIRGRGLDGTEGHQSVVDPQNPRLVSQGGRQLVGVAGRADGALNEGDVVAHVDVDGRTEEQALAACDLRQAIGQLR